MEILLLFLLPTLSTIGDMYCVPISIFTGWVIVCVILIAVVVEDSSRKWAINSLLLSYYWRNIDLLVNLCYAMAHPTTPERTISSAKGVLNRHFDLNHNFDILPTAPTIFVCNYVVDRLENTFVLWIPRRLTILMSEGFASLSGLDTFLSVIPLTTAGEYERVNRLIDKAFARDSSILCYVQKPLFINGENHGRIKRGIFDIARRKGYTITPLYISPIETQLKAIMHQTIWMRAGPTFRVENVGSAVQTVRDFYRKTQASISFEKDLELSDHTFWRRIEKPPCKRPKSTR